MISGPIERDLIDKLSVMMDPKTDNAYLTIDEFVSVGKRWMGFVKEKRHSDNDDENRLNHKFILSPSFYLGKERHF